MLLRRLALAAAFTLCLPAQAQAFPDGPIKWIVNWPAGGGQDTTSRLVAEALSAKLGVPVVVENHSGAGGLTGMRKIAAAEADGYTIGMMGSSSVIQQYTTEQPVHMKDLSVLAFFGPDPAALTVHAGKGAADLPAYVSKAKSAPGKTLNGNDPPRRRILHLGLDPRIRARPQAAESALQGLRTHRHRAARRRGGERHRADSASA